MADPRPVIDVPLVEADLGQGRIEGEIIAGDRIGNLGGQVGQVCLTGVVGGHAVLVARALEVHGTGYGVHNHGDVGHQHHRAAGVIGVLQIHAQGHVTRVGDVRGCQVVGVGYGRGGPL